MLDDILLRIAKVAIISKFKDYSFDKTKILQEYPYLDKNGAVFVTLNQNENLRGCVGSLQEHRKLFDDIVHNALLAGFHDSRFNPLCEDDLESLTLEVSLLSPSKKLKYCNFDDLKKKIIPFEDGLILKYKQHSGTFLPQVWEQLTTPELFLNHLAQKAGLKPDIYDLNPEIYRYKVEKTSKRFDEILPL
jgi:AmmeMemoRadiSam system protein A